MIDFLLFYSVIIDSVAQPFLAGFDAELENAQVFFFRSPGTD